MTESNHLSTLLRWLRTRGARHGVAALLAVVTLCLPLELAFRAGDHFGLVHPEYAFAMKREGKYAGRIWEPREFVADSQFNDDGLRGPSLDARPGERRRVVIAGDSFVEARQVDFADSFPIVAEAALRDVRVVPVRVGNHVFHERPERFRDFFDRLFDGEDGRPRADGVVYSLREWPLVQTRPPRYAIKRALYRDTRLSRFLDRYSLAPIDILGFACARMREWAMPRNEPLSGAEAARREAVEAMAGSTLDIILADAERLDLRVGVHYIPVRSEVQALRRGDQPEWRPVDSLRALCEARGIPFEDATRDVAEHGGPTPFLDHDGHPNESGHGAMAPSLVRLLERMGYPRR